MVDVDPEEVLDRLDLQRRAAERVGGVDLLVALAGDRGERVAGDRDLAERAAAGVDDHQRVGAGRQAVVGVNRRRRRRRRGTSASVGFPFSSGTPSWRTSVPITRMFWPSASMAAGSRRARRRRSSSSFDFWIWAETAKATMLISSQTPAAIATHLQDLAARSASRPGPRGFEPPSPGQPLAQRRPVAGPLEAASRLVDGVAGALRRRAVARVVARAREPARTVSALPVARVHGPRSGPVDVVFGAIRTFGVAGCHYAVILPHALPVSCFVTAPGPAPARHRDDRRRPRRHEDARRRRRRRRAGRSTGGSPPRPG